MGFVTGFCLNFKADCYRSLFFVVCQRDNHVKKMIYLHEKSLGWRKVSQAVADISQQFVDLTRAVEC